MSVGSQPILGRDIRAVLPAAQNIVVLHPQCRCHNNLLGQLLVGDSVIAITLPPSELSLDGIWRLLSAELRVVTANPLPPTPNTLQEGAETFAQALQALSPVHIVLMGYDNAGQDVDGFVAALAGSLHERDKIIIAGRSWPAGLLDALPSSDSVALLPVSTDDMLLDYLSLDANKTMLEVRALGSGQVLINGNLIAQWDGALPRDLFFYFIDRGMTTRDEVFSTFWPNLSTREATNVFHVTKRKISEILNVDLTVYSSGFYRISPDVDLHYDVVAFVNAFQTSAVVEETEARQLLSRAINLHERGYLSGSDMPWVKRRREELQIIYTDALTAMARFHEADGDLTTALGLYGRAFGLHPHREDLARAQMKLCWDTQHGEQAMAVYQRLVDELRGKLSVSPSPETESLAEKISSALGG